jgi:hypothetical protein
MARVAFAGLAAVSLVGLIAVNAGSSATAAEQSSITVNWLGDSSAASQFQPARSASGPEGFEYNEFKNISVSVAQSKNLVDQAVVVSVSGFQNGTTDATDGGGPTYSDAMNFMQAMQCWGDPASPDFRTTCEWGGKNVTKNGLGYSVYGDNVYRVAPGDTAPSADTTRDVPFKPVSGSSVTGRYVLDSKGNISYPILTQFGPNTTNEVSSARIKSDGTGTFDFQMQTSISAPQMGCGSPDHLRCWLVLVPRGTVFGGNGRECSSALQTDVSLSPFTFGEADSLQGGSPINSGCKYWANRIVVPLDFNPVAAPCPGGAEVRVVGAQLLISAMSSWQPKLCSAAGGAFSFASNPDSVARDQLLDQGTNIAFSSYPIVRKNLDTDQLQNEFDTTTLSYAPVAIGALTLSYFAEGPSGRITSLKLTPRLVAKLLTQSYAFEVPGSSSEGNGQTQLGAVNRSYRLMADDPDFRAVNPDYALYRTNPSLVLPGPSGADAIAQLWKWVQSDSDARDFLDGKGDPWHMTVNPYYLPVGNSAAKVPQYDNNNQLIVDALGQPVLKAVGNANVDGSPLSLSAASIDTFPLSDQSEVPHKLDGGIRTRIGSLAFLPYAIDFPSAAVIAFRTNPGPRIVWDPNAIDAAGDAGAWASPGPQLPGQRFVIAVTDLASSTQFDLSVAQLQAANGSTFVVPSTASMTAAMSSGLTTTSVAAVQQVDPAKVSTDSYPLTTVVYAIVNLSASSKANLQSYSSMINYAVGDGQVAGVQPGQLPPGYLPLTSALVGQSKAAAMAMASYTAPAISSYNPGTGSPDLASGGYSPGESSGSIAVGSPATPSAESIAPEATPAKTPAVADTPLTNSALAISLGVGLAGSLLSPLLLRGRRQW